MTIGWLRDENSGPYLSPGTGHAAASCFRSTSNPLPADRFLDRQL
jgi:hypothetical protein